MKEYDTSVLRKHFQALHVYLILHSGVSVADSLPF